MKHEFNSEPIRAFVERSFTPAERFLRLRTQRLGCCLDVKSSGPWVITISYLDDPEEISPAQARNLADVFSAWLHEAADFVESENAVGT